MEAGMRIAVIFTLVMCALSFGEVKGASEKLSPLPQELQGGEIPGFYVVALDSRNSLYNEKLANEAKKPGVKRVVLSFFDTKCVNCQAEFVLLKNNSAKLKENGVLVNLINVGEKIDSSGAKVNKFVKEFAGDSFPFYFDQDFVMLKNFGLKLSTDVIFPMIVVMDSDLRVLGVFKATGNDFPQVLWGNL
jgi:thiol-disulfide isomerase/thioredoxin